MPTSNFGLNSSKNSNKKEYDFNNHQRNIFTTKNSTILDATEELTSDRFGHNRRNSMYEYTNQAYQKYKEKPKQTSTIETQAKSSLNAEEIIKLMNTKLDSVRNEFMTAINTISLRSYNSQSSKDNRASQKVRDVYRKSGQSFYQTQFSGNDRKSEDRTSLNEREMNFNTYNQLNVSGNDQRFSE